MANIEQLIKSLDVDIDDETQIRLFRLRFADPQETADLLTQLFPDPTLTSGAGGSYQPRYGSGAGGGYSRYGGGGGSSRYGGGPGGGFGARPASYGAGSGANTSDHMKRKGQVISVPDQRTASLIVSADKTLMVQIADMIKQLDSDPSKKQKVFVYSLENADVSDVEPVLQDLFQTSSRSTGQNNNNYNNNVLNTRNQTINQQTIQSSTLNNRLP